MGHSSALGRWIRNLIPLAAVIAGLCSPLPAQEEAGGDGPLRVLFLGNSYTQQNKLPAAVQAMAASARIPVEIEVGSRTPGGCTFERHWIEGSSVELIREGGWDVVVLQEQSQRPVEDPLLMLRYGKELIREVQKAGARPLLFLTWAPEDQPERIAGLAKAYRGLAEQTGAELAPVGLAWRDALEERPDFSLHQADGSHPNPRGSYLAACVLLGWIAELDPRSLGDVGRRALVQPEMDFLHAVAARHVPASALLPMASGLRAARVGDDRVGLAWDKAERRPVGWRVERRLAEEEDAPFALVAELKGSAASWNDRDCAPATAYAYRVWPVLGEDRQKLGGAGVARALELEEVAGARPAVRAEDGPVRLRWAGGEAELAAGEERVLAIPVVDGEFRLEAEAVSGRATARLFLLPAAEALAALPPLVVTTEGS